MKWENYNKALKCLMCDGYEYQCKSYTPLSNDELNPELCAYYRVIEVDLDILEQYKVMNYRNKLTFEGLEKIIKLEKDPLYKVKPCQR